MSTAEHASTEALSAFVDGEAPEWADHVAGCPRCRETAAELRAVAAAVAAPPAPAPAATREAAIAAALEAAATGTALAGPALADAPPRSRPAVAGHQAQRARFERRRAPRSWAAPAAAAVVAVLLGLAGVILTTTRAADRSTTFAGPAADATRESALPGAPDVPVADLGDIADAATLRARALGSAPGTSGASSEGRSSSSANSGAASEATASTASGGTGSGTVVVGPAPGVPSGPAPGATSGPAILNSEPSASSGTGVTGGTVVAGGATAAGGTSVAGPRAVGTRPCEEQARRRDPNLGPVTLFATARQGPVPAYVLGFASPGPVVTLLLLAQDGCAELLRSAGP